MIWFICSSTVPCSNRLDNRYISVHVCHDSETLQKYIQVYNMPRLTRNILSEMSRNYINVTRLYETRKGLCWKQTIKLFHEMLRKQTNHRGPFCGCYQMTQQRLEQQGVHHNPAGLETSLFLQGKQSVCGI